MLIHNTQENTEFVFLFLRYIFGDIPLYYIFCFRLQTLVQGEMKWIPAVAIGNHG